MFGWKESQRRSLLLDIDSAGTFSEERCQIEQPSDEALQDSSPAR
ncbi:hypothetical protein CCP4SC76_1390002 [Gammaproteobacteria bacterium]